MSHELRFEAIIISIKINIRNHAVYSPDTCAILLTDHVVKKYLEFERKNFEAN